MQATDGGNMLKVSNAGVGCPAQHGKQATLTTRR